MQNSQSIDGCYHRYPFVVMSDIGVRDKGNMFIMVTNLVVHHSITDIINKTAKFVCILDVVEKALGLPLLLQWLEFSQNISQLPGDHFLSGLILDLVECNFTFPVPFSLLPPQHHPQEWACRVCQKGP